MSLEEGEGKRKGKIKKIVGDFEGGGKVARSQDKGGKGAWRQEGLIAQQDDPVLRWTGSLQPWSSPASYQQMKVTTSLHHVNVWRFQV